MKALIIKAVNEAIQSLENKIEVLKEQGVDTDTVGNLMWDIKRYTELKIYLENLSKSTSLTFYRQGGSWLGTVREWIQRKAFNGETVNWESNDYLKLKPLTVSDLEMLACGIAAASISESTKTMFHFIDTKGK